MTSQLPPVSGSPQGSGSFKGLYRQRVPNNNRQLKHVSEPASSAPSTAASSSFSSRRSSSSYGHSGSSGLPLTFGGPPGTPAPGEIRRARSSCSSRTPPETGRKGSSGSLEDQPEGTRRARSSSLTEGGNTATDPVRQRDAPSPIVGSPDRNRRTDRQKEMGYSNANPDVIRQRDVQSPGGDRGNKRTDRQKDVGSPMGSPGGSPGIGRRTDRNRDFATAGIIDRPRPNTSSLCREDLDKLSSHDGSEKPQSQGMQSPSRLLQERTSRSRDPSISSQGHVTKPDTVQDAWLAGSATKPSGQGLSNQSLAEHNATLSSAKQELHSSKEPVSVFTTPSHMRSSSQGREQVSAFIEAGQKLASAAASGSCAKSLSHPAGQQLQRGSRDDSFLSTISESSRENSSSSSTPGHNSMCSELTVEVSSDCSSMDDVGVLSDFSQIFGSSDNSKMKELLRHHGFDKPLELQRKVVPLVMSAFSSAQKSFISIQGKPQSGKTMALVLGILGAITSDRRGLRAIILSPSTSGDFRKYFDICSMMSQLRMEYFEGPPGPPPSEPICQSASASVSVQKPEKKVFGGSVAVKPASPTVSRRQRSSIVAALEDDAEEEHEKDDVGDAPTGVDQYDLQRLSALALNVDQGPSDSAVNVISCHLCSGRFNRWRCSRCSPSPSAIFGHPSRILPLLREAPVWGVDLSTVEVLALDDTEEMIQSGLIDEVVEVCMILKHFSHQRLRHVILSHLLSREASSMLNCLKNSLLRQQNFFGLRAHQMKAKAQSVNNYFVLGPTAKWPQMLAGLHRALSLPKGIVFHDASPAARNDAAEALRKEGFTVSVWTAQQSREARGPSDAFRSASEAGGQSFYFMPSDPVVLNLALPKARCVVHFDMPVQDLSLYGLRLTCLEKAPKRKGAPSKECSVLKAPPGSPSHSKSSPKAPSKQQPERSMSVLFLENQGIIPQLEKSFGIKMQLIPTAFLPD